VTFERALADARSALEAGDLEGAAERIEALRADHPDDPGVLHLQGLMLLARRSPIAAADVLERVVGLTGEGPQALIDLGRALNNAGRLGAAARAFRRAAERDPGSADARAFLGHALRGRGRLEEAEAAFGEALRLHPGHARALKGLGSVRLAGGDAAGAAEALREALRHDPEDAHAAAHLGAALHRRGDPAGAERAYRHALEIDPGHAEAWLNLGITLQDSGRLATAIEAYREGVRLAPRSVLAHNRLGDALLAAGRAGEALAATDSLLALDPGNPAAIATRGLALGELGRDREAGSLFDWDRLVRTADVRPPPGQDVGAFNRALRQHVLEHPSLSYEPEGHATRLGRHTGDLLAGEKGPVAALEQAVLAAAAAYLRALTPVPGHPFPGPVPREPRLAMWAVVMDTAGHQLPHIHPVAWLSGVYYVDLPDSIGADASDPAGWIEFGRPPDDFRLRRRPPCSLHRPVEGRLFLFPSYFYHRTIPFPGPEPRICIAFDVLRQERPPVP
jgi:tetratricopeptide (TPR) repeat protein